MRLTQVFFSNYFKRYVERELHQGKLRRQWHPLTGWKEMKRKKFAYNEHRPWTDEFKMANQLGKRVVATPVKPLKEWNVFVGDQVQIQVGRDKGKVGIINSIIKERNWAFVEGLNNKYSVQSRTGSQPVCVRQEQPLLVPTQVKLVDPSTNESTEAVWRYTEQGEQVRVSVDTGRIIPLPDGAKMGDDLVIPARYVEGDKDTLSKELTKVTFQPKLCSFAEEIMEEMGIKEDRKPAKTYWY